MQQLLEYSDFKRVAATSFVSDHEVIAEDSGVYLLLIRGGDALLKAAGYYRLEQRDPWAEDGWSHLYTGSSALMQTRLKRHLLGDARVSTFRKTMLALEQQCGALTATGVPFDGSVHPELALDDWLEEQCQIATCEVGYFFDEEAHFLARWPSPLNITGRRGDPFSRRLMALRSVRDGRRVAAHCQPFLFV